MRTINKMIMAVVFASTASVVMAESSEEDVSAASAPIEGSAAPVAPSSIEEIAGGICAGCHSADGNSVIPMNPILAGQHSEYISKQLMDFKANGEEPPKRNSPVMSAMVAALSQNDVKKLGEYYAKQTMKPSQGSTDEKILEQGRILYHGGNIEHNVPACASCHGPNGSGIPPRYPAVAGQHTEYTMMQLGLFNTGERANDNDIMHKVVSRMSAPEKRAVSEYISTLR